MRSKEVIEKDLQELQQKYNSLCAKYGDCLISLRYWNEQKEKLEKDIDTLGDMQKRLNLELQHAKSNTAADSNQADATSGSELPKENVDK